MDRITDTHVYFWGDPTFSNWGEAEFTYKRGNFANSEQAFMFEKAMLFEDYEIAAEILRNDNPSYVKKLGRKVHKFDANIWSSHRYQIMLNVCLAKFEQNEDLLKILLSTGDKIIVEASPFDRIWGVGLAWNDDKILDKKNWQGLNLLGEVLMDVRKQLKSH